jgi:hypothetical protein
MHTVKTLSDGTTLRIEGERDEDGYAVADRVLVRERGSVMSTDITVLLSEVMELQSYCDYILRKHGS